MNDTSYLTFPSSFTFGPAGWLWGGGRGVQIWLRQRPACHLTQMRSKPDYRKKAVGRKWGGPIADICHCPTLPLAVIAYNFQSWCKITFSSIYIPYIPNTPQETLNTWSKTQNMPPKMTIPSQKMYLRFFVSRKVCLKANFLTEWSNPCVWGSQCDICAPSYCSHSAKIIIVTQAFS